MSRTLLTLCLAIFAMLATLPAYAQQWSEFAYISQTLGVNANRLCLGEESRGELGCPAYAPYVDSATGWVGIGTSSPVAALNVSGSVRITSGSLIASAASTTLAVKGYADFGSIEAYGAGADYLTKRPLLFNRWGGNVGIAGIDIPSSTLHVGGAIRLKWETSTTLNTCDADRTGAIKYQSGDFYYCRNGTGWESLTSLTNSSATLISGTTTMVSGWPDAILCTTASNIAVFWHSYTINSNGNQVYRFIQSPNSPNDHTVTFTPAKAYSTYEGTLVGDCIGKSIAQHYAATTAFNFIGNSGTGGILGDRIISGTTGVYASQDTSLSLATAGVERMVIGTNGEVGIGQQPVSGTAASVSGSGIQLTNLTTDPSKTAYLSITASGNSSLGLNAFGSNYDAPWAEASTVELAAYSSTKALQFRTSRTGYAAPFIFKMGSTGGTPAIEVARITSTGLALGLITPTAKLEVSGTISATLVKLSNNPSNPCDGAAVGAVKTVNGKLFICRQ